MKAGLLLILLLMMPTALAATLETKDFIITAKTTDIGSITRAEYTDGELKIEATKDFKADIQLKKTPGIHNNVILYKADAKQKLWEDIGIRAEVTKNNLWWNFSVEHFSTYQVPQNYTTIENCLSDNNMTGNICSITVYNHSETFTNKSFEFNGTASIRMYIIDSSNLTIDFNGARMTSNGGNIFQTGGTRSYNLNFSNLWVNRTANYRFFSLIEEAVNLTLTKIITAESCGAFLYTHFNARNENTTIWVKDCYSACRLHTTECLYTYYNKAYIDNMTCIGKAFELGNSNNVIIKNSRAENTYIGGGNTANISIKNSTLINSTIVLGTADNTTIIGNNIINVTRADAIKITTGKNWIIENNTFKNAGSVSYSGEYLTSLYYFNISGTIYNGCMVYINNAGNSLCYPTNDEYNCNKAWMQGTTTFQRAWAYIDTNNIVGCGAGAKVTAILENGYPLTCPQIQAMYGGSCDYAKEDGAIHHNGQGSNYTWNQTLLDNTKNTGVTYPPYLRYNNVTNYDTAGINTRGINITIKGNTFETCTVPMIINKTGQEITENHIYHNTIINLTNVNYCVSGTGNFYEEELTPPETDCGRSNITYPINMTTYQLGEDTLLITWTAQDARLPITYVIYENITGGQACNSTGNSCIWNYESIGETNTARLTLKPWDGAYNATNDQITIGIQYGTHEWLIGYIMVIAASLGIIRRKNRFIAALICLISTIGLGYYINYFQEGTIWIMAGLTAIFTANLLMEATKNTETFKY